jgi:SAM-dependent methyltransferase
VREEVIILSQDWYEQHARRFGGYRKLWESTIKGPNGEAAFTSWLRETIPQHPRVMDIGCGDGLYTLHMSALAKHITGIDYAPTMVALARRYQQSAAVTNATFLELNGREPLPFDNGEFDLIFSRRGPSSHLMEARRVLRRGGLVAGIHSGAREEIIGRVQAAGFRLIRNEAFAGVEVLPSLEDYALFLSRLPGFPDYTDPSLRTDLEAKAREVETEDGYTVPFWRFIWVGVNE